MNRPTIAQIVKEIEYRTGLTQQEIADKIGYSRPFLNRHVNGKEDHSEKIAGRLRSEFKDVLTDMNYTTTATVKAKSSNDESLAIRIAKLEKEIAELKAQLQLIIALIKK